MKKFLWVLCGFALIIVVILFAFNNQKADLQNQIAALESDNASLSQKMTDDAASAQTALDEAVAAKDTEMETLRQENADALAAVEAQLADKEKEMQDALTAAEADKQAAVDEAVKATQEAADADKQAAVDEAVKAAKEVAEADKQTAVDEAVKAAQETAEADKQAAVEAAVAPLNEQIASLTQQLEEMSLMDVISRDEHVAAVKEAVDQATQEADAKLQAAKEEWDAAMETAKQEWEAAKEGIAEKAKEGLYTLEQVNETVTQKVEEALRDHGILRDEASDETEAEAVDGKITLPSLESYLKAVLDEDLADSAEAQVACILSYFNDVLPGAGFAEAETVMEENGFTMSLLSGETCVVTCSVTFADGAASIVTEYGEGVEVYDYDGEALDSADILAKYTDAAKELLPAAE